MKKSILIIFLILIVDQFSKIWMKTHFELGDEFKVLGLDWFRIHFLENYGMAWGTEFGGKSGKLFLTSFRLIAIIGIGYWLHNAVKKHSPQILIFAIALIFAGALGNIIDSVFYGMIFSDSSGQIASFLPEGGGYSSLFHGKVVDLFYFPFLENAELPSWIPVVNFNWPDWVPFIGERNFSIFTDRYFTFFEYVFNVADASITTGVALLLVFNKKAFPKSKVIEPVNNIVPPVIVKHYQKPKA
jgi:signal peptidase II